LFIGLRTVRLLIGLARMVPTRSSAQATSRNAVGAQQAPGEEPVRRRQRAREAS
jgi:hypothetical protein